MKHLLTLLALLMAWGSNAQNIVDSRQREIVIKNVSVLPMNTETVLNNQTVVVKNGEIAAMGTKVVYAKDALVIDAKGKFLMPGLAEMHAHVPPVDDIEPMKEVLLLFAANGVTTIRGMLGHPLHLELRKKIQTGEILGPRKNRKDFVFHYLSSRMGHVKNPLKHLQITNLQSLNLQTPSLLLQD